MTTEGKSQIEPIVKHTVIALAIEHIVTEYRDAGSLGTTRILLALQFLLETWTHNEYKSKSFSLSTWGDILLFCVTNDVHHAHERSNSS